MFESIQREPNFIMVQTETGEWKTASAAGSFRKDDVQVETVIEGEALAVYLTADETPVKLIRLRWKSREPMRGTILGDAWERGYGDLRWENMMPHRAMPWYFLIQNENITAGYGVRVRPGSLCFWQLDPAGITLWLDVRSGGRGVVLRGRKLLAAQVVFRNYEGISAFRAARIFCRAMCSDPILPPHPVYGFNNWYYAYGHSSHEEILEDTDYLAFLTEGLENRPYMIIDDCWQKDRSDEYIGGPWIGNERFPNMRLLAEQIHGKGVRPGIWIRFLLDRSPEIPAECRLSHNGCLDPSHPEVIAHIRRDVERICSWGFQLIKHDFSTYDLFGKWGYQMLPFMTDNGWYFYDQGRTSAEIVIDFYRSILETATSSGALILGCNTVGHLGAGLMHMNRTGDDTSGILWERTMRIGVNTLAFRMPQHRSFYDVDADCIGVTENIPWEYNRMWGELLSKSGTSLFASVKPGVLTAGENRELSGFLAQSSLQAQIAEPLDWQETWLPQDWLAGGERVHYDWFEDTGLRVFQGQYEGKVWDALYNRSLF